MLIRSLTLASLFAFAAPLLAADGDSPLAQDRGRARPLIVFAPSTVDANLLKLRKALEEPANRDGFKQRNMVLYTVINTIGQRDGKDLDPQATMALIRELKLGAGSSQKFVLVGKDGEKKLEQGGYVEPAQLFSLVDQLPATEKDASAPAAAAAPAQEPGAKPAKNAKPSKAPQPLDD
ncbi:DUF4174 domain-containing protein [Pseudomonas sp. UBA4194]|uniref:DUF4174 domain-containing protein n=1 Tax=Pseudomonas sp. UBA4194 TaxID=1947317 RepID=UPI0025EE6639|nr:DUF4174 domain-containing protein [Pseudomonas sp. UBA4194]